MAFLGAPVWDQESQGGWGQAGPWGRWSKTLKQPEKPPFIHLLHGDQSKVSLEKWFLLLKT